MVQDDFKYNMFRADFKYNILNADARASIFNTDFVNANFIDINTEI